VRGRRVEGVRGRGGEGVRRRGGEGARGRGGEEARGRGGEEVRGRGGEGVRGMPHPYKTRRGMAGGRSRGIRAAGLEGLPCEIRYDRAGLRRRVFSAGRLFCIFRVVGPFRTTRGSAPVERFGRLTAGASSGIMIRIIDRTPFGVSGKFLDRGASPQAPLLEMTKRPVQVPL
jgi:hypothetical protein